MQKPALQTKKVNAILPRNPTHLIPISKLITSLPTKACQSGEETSVTKEVSVDFAGNVAFDLAKAVEAGLDFGVSVAYSTTKTESTAEPCPGTDDPRGCICGLQYQEFKQEAWGTRHSSNACGDKVSEDFDVTAPIKIDDSAEVQWRSCRSKRSECKDIENMPLCADGL